MNKETVLVAIIAVLVGGIGGYMLGQEDGHDWPMYEDMDDMSDLHREHMMDDDEMPMGDLAAAPGHMMEMTVSSEKEFIEGMIPHHQEAIDTAKEVIERGGTTPDIKTLVENIVTAQEAEVAEMKRWYQDWYGEAYQDNGAYRPMMRELANLSGADLDEAFLTDMIAHHMGAIMMAKSVEAHVEHEEMAELTKAIETTQSAEIAQMREMLRGL